jgi:hypothetical protein
MRLCSAILILAAWLLASCAPLPTYADTQATAVLSGCWPGAMPTPRAVTVTPFGGVLPTASSIQTATSGPAATRLPTTTPYPRCTPLPGETQVPWPSAVPNPPPYPTQEARSWQTGADQRTTLFLPGNLLTLDLAAHPTENWVAAASVIWSGNQDPDRVMVSVLNPNTHTWSPARQIDLGIAGIGRYSRSVAIAITGDRGVHVAWAMSDPDFTDNDPPPGTWLSSSSDFGRSWSAPERIATGCKRVNDLAASVTGEFMVLLTCEAGAQTGQPVLLVRQSGGQWLAPERLPLAVWQYSEGKLALIGEGPNLRIVGMTLAGQAGQPVAYLFQRNLIGSSSLQSRAILLTGQRPTGLRMWYPHSVVFRRPQADGSIQTGVTFSWSSADGDLASIYAMTSLDSGASWGEIEEVFYRSATTDRALFAPLAYDPAADRLAAIFTCCGDARWEVTPSTHYGRWSVPGSGVWHAPDASDAPLVLGSRVAAETVAAQSANSRQVWLAWVEEQRKVEIRSLNLNQVIPVDQYRGR